MADENITLRKKHNVLSTSSSESSLFNATAMSMPDTSLYNDEVIEKLREEINNLKINLQSAHQEIENLLSHNMQLKTELDKSNKIIELYKKVNSGEVKCSTPKAYRKIQKRTRLSSLASTPVKITHEAHNDHSMQHIDIDPGSSQDVFTSQNNTIAKLAPPAKPSPPLAKHNLCVLSSEISNRIYTMCEKTHLKNYNMCHYRTPKCGIEYLLKNIDKKVQNFTRADYCIIFIGEEDFRKTHNYIELVTYIRDKLITLNHTNFVICLPTFKYMDNTNIMFNSRVDTFNNLIYMDVETYHYAYILDSNLNLSYTWDTYNQRHGHLNNNGFTQVVSDLQDFILDLETVNTSNSKLLRDEPSDDYTNVDRSKSPPSNINEINESAHSNCLFRL